jgi:hypothetical protein
MEIAKNVQVASAWHLCAGRGGETLRVNFGAKDTRLCFVKTE